MAIGTVTSKGQMTLPKAIRDDLNVKSGDRLEVIQRNEEYILRRRKSALDLFAELPPYEGRPLTIEGMDEAIGDEVWGRNKPR